MGLGDTSARPSGSLSSPKAHKFLPSAWRVLVRAKKRRMRAPRVARAMDNEFGPNPDQHAGAKAFIGHLRRAPDGIKWRLYLNLDFSDYIEIPADALIEQRDMASKSNPLGGHIV